MTEYKSLDKAEIKGRGTVYIVENDKDRFRDNTGLIGTEIILDGRNCIIKGIESFLTLKIHKGDKIGLMVEFTSS